MFKKNRTPFQAQAANEKRGLSSVIDDILEGSKGDGVGGFFGGKVGELGQKFFEALEVTFKGSGEINGLPSMMVAFVRGLGFLGALVFETGKKLVDIYMKTGSGSSVKADNNSNVTRSLDLVADANDSGEANRLISDIAAFNSDKKGANSLDHVAVEDSSTQTSLVSSSIL